MPSLKLISASCVNAPIDFDRWPDNINVLSHAKCQIMTPQLLT